MLQALKYVTPFVKVHFVGLDKEHQYCGLHMFRSLANHSLTHRVQYPANRGVRGSAN